jgi:hypothetical protein
MVVFLSRREGDGVGAFSQTSRENAPMNIFLHPKTSVAVKLPPPLHHVEWPNTKAQPTTALTTVKIFNHHSPTPPLLIY